MSRHRRTLRTSLRTGAKPFGKNDGRALKGLARVASEVSALPPRENFRTKKEGPHKTAPSGFGYLQRGPTRGEETSPINGNLTRK